MKVGLWKATGNAGGVRLVSPVPGETEAVFNALAATLHEEFPGTAWDNLYWETNGWTTESFNAPVVGRIKRKWGGNRA